MRLAAIRETYAVASSKASEIARQLSFAGVAIVWLFSGATVSDEPLRIAGRLLAVGFFLVLALALDLLHAVYRTAAWGLYARYLELSGRAEDEEMDAPAWINWPSISFFGGKLAAVAVAYALLGIFLLQKL